MDLTDDVLEWAKAHSLLASGKGNVKINKNTIPTFYLALNPHKQNSKKVNLCSHASKECVKACLVSSGMNTMPNAIYGKKMRTELFVQHKNVFLSKLWAELSKLNERKDKTLIRLNVTSDINFEEEFKNLSKVTGLNYSLERFSNLLFYHYTKVPNYVKENTLPNSQYTFSYSGYNWKQCEEFLVSKKANVAVVFFPTVPTEYKGFPVINGDITDERTEENDGVGNIIGLRYKIARGMDFNPLNSKFVINL